MASELENTMAEKLKVVGEYHLIPNEKLSDDGRSIICNVCGKVRYQKGFSKIHQKPLWFIANNSADKKFLEVGYGCDCMEKVHSKKELARFDYERPLYEKDENGEFKKDKKGNLILIRPRRVFNFDYGKKWMLEAVPQWGLYASIPDRFYQRKWNGTFEAINMAVKSIEEAEISEKDASVLSDIRWMLISGKGQCLKTSMLCVLRFSLLSNSYPTVMVNVPQLLNFKKYKSELWDFACEVLVLLVDDVGKATLSREQAEVIDEILSYRKRTSKPTIVASNETVEGLVNKGYTDSLVKDMSDMFKIDMSIMDSENITF